MTKFIELHFADGRFTRIINTDCILSAGPRGSASTLTMRTQDGIESVEADESYDELRMMLLGGKCTCRDDAYVSASEAARMLGMPSGTLWRWAREGRLTARHPSSHRTQYLLSDIEAIMASPQHRKGAR